ncbi:MAG: TIGR04282 family arsenosugar biosynthesis glycosyltransferase [Gemmatimonadota bacterium]|uniref:TIGR04282 family arsenosugar biosynthesis glycosyltransferase n=1 Tax=Candidatus Palauibacter scopulicola TaxID=3056741 RepID=UPI00239287F9|nr:TIGR04282 family arsenosugar biosynthesis glycosyltransferase [Candidatus Palauibacter scopulicola]MDE2663894.1 TIGR04282 family arsenosugar biosynthesis glycosyltransferase [Candidatus Palauibacter scopulicola]
MAAPRLLLFGRLPEPGHVKTRLDPELTREGSAVLYAAFLDDAMKLAPDGVAVELWVPARPGALERLGARYPAARVRLQPGGSLGDRLEAAFARAFRDGVDRAVALGSDHPTLPADFLVRAFDALANSPVALGPSLDGGYYAVGLRGSAWPRARGLFAEAPWSTSALFTWTRARAASLGLDCTELPPWYDVDRPADLARMAGDLIEGSATAAAWVRLAPPTMEPEG